MEGHIKTLLDHFYCLRNAKLHPEIILYKIPKSFSLKSLLKSVKGMERPTKHLQSEVAVVERSTLDARDRRALNRFLAIKRKSTAPQITEELNASL